MKPPRRRCIWLISLFGLALAFVGFRLALPTLAKRYGEAQLNRDPLYHGQIDRLKIHLWKGAYTAVGFKLERVAEGRRLPFVSADEIEVGLGWRELLHGAIRARIQVRNLDLLVVLEKRGGEKKVAVGRATTEGKKAEAQDWKQVFKNLVPIDLDRLEVHGRSLHFKDLTADPKIDVYLDRIELTGTNLTNGKGASDDLFGDLTLRAQAMRSGDLVLQVHLNPLVSPPEFKVTTELKGLDLTNLNDFFKAYGGFDVKRGEFSLYSEMATADNRIKGYAKPIIKHLSVADFERDKKQGLLHAVWEGIVGLVAGVIKNQQKGQQAAEIPFEGRLDDPDADAWATVGSILKNMLIQPIRPGVEGKVDLRDVRKR